MEHVDDELLAGITLGDVADDATRAHLAQCAACQASVDELRMLVGSFRGPVPELSTPGAHVWDGIAARLQEEYTPPKIAEPALDSSSGYLRTGGPATGPGALSSAGNVTPLRPKRGAPRPALGWLAAACAAGILAGGAGTWVATRPDATPAPVVLAAAGLDTLDTKQSRGAAEVLQTGTTVDLAVSTQPLQAPDGYLEVWLINKDLKRMVSIGVLPQGARSGSFPITKDLLDQGYVIVDVSREAFDDRPQHSGDSLVRGTLA